VGFNAARTFAGVGAQVTVIDEPDRLVDLDRGFDIPGRIRTMYAYPDQVRRATAYANVLVGAAILVPGQRAPLVVTEEMVTRMPHGAVIIDVTHPGLRATAIATLALSNNLLGLAPGPYLAGVLSDATTLTTALTIMPVTGLLASACFLLAGRTYERDSISNALRTGTPVTGAATQ
jgi:hypothetical protein